jgi:hypothetical protein
MILSRQQLFQWSNLSIEQMSQIIKSETKIEQIITNEVLRGERYHEK